MSALIRRFLGPTTFLFIWLTGTVGSLADDATNAQEVAMRDLAPQFHPDPPSQAPGPNARRALGQITLVNGIGMGNYFAREGANRVDWEYQPTARDFGRKITDGWSLDTNTFGVNFLGHTYSGVFYYQVGRSNGYSPLGSFLVAFGGSLMWEYAGEYRERVSLNDMVVTPVGGTLFGEVFHQFSLAAEHSGLPRAARGALAFVLDPFRVINGWWDAKSPAPRRRSPIQTASEPAQTPTL